MNEQIVYFLRGIYESTAHMVTDKQGYAAALSAWGAPMARLLIEAAEAGKKAADEAKRDDTRATGGGDSEASGGDSDKTVPTRAKRKRP
jgi:hypothetical protein